MATLSLQLALFVLFFSVKTETNGQTITIPVELHTTVDVPCRCPICPESTVTVHWYMSSSSNVYRKDGTAFASWYGEGTGSSKGFGIKDDFSLIMYNVNLTNEGLYRCIVTPAGGAARCKHDVKVGIYAKPDTSPVIEYILQTDGINVTCSISNVFPMTFPILTTKEENGTVNINRDNTSNTDGTFNTTVTQWFPANEKDTTIECLYSYLDFNIMSSLRIDDNYITDQPKEGDRMQNNMTHTNFYITPSGLWMVWVILVKEVLFFIVIVYVIKTGRVLFNPTLSQNNTTDLDRHEHHEEIDQEEELAKSTRILLFGERSYAVITLIIQITVLIMICACLATISCNCKIIQKQADN